MNVWIIGDTHFNHQAILHYCHRPFRNVSQMNEALIHNWNSRIGEEDLVFHLGDFAFGHTSEILARLKGHIILIRGNHDDRAMLRRFVWASHMGMMIGDYYCLLNHRPFFTDPKLKKYSDSTISKTEADLYDRIICGHAHDVWKVHGKNVNVGVDQTDFMPLGLDELAMFLRGVKHN